MLASSEFHTEGPANEKQLFPNFDLDLGKIASPSEVLSAAGPQRCRCRSVEYMSTPVPAVSYIPTGNI